MKKIYKIYINQTLLILAESAEPGAGSFQALEAEGFDFCAFYNGLKANPVRGVFRLLTADPKGLFKQIKKTLNYIKAAGGLVRNEENRYLFIFRKGKWDLPKGKIDAGEKTKQAAVREVEEECGIKISKLGEKACNTYHAYEMFGQLILKKTSWFYMQANGQTKLVPQLEEDITEARWIAPGDLDPVKQNTYPLIKEVIGLIEE